jgi:hypothetical protein
MGLAIVVDGLDVGLADLVMAERRKSFCRQGGAFDGRVLSR